VGADDLGATLFVPQPEPAGSSKRVSLHARSSPWLQAVLEPVCCVSRQFCRVAAGLLRHECMKLHTKSFRTLWCTHQVAASLAAGSCCCC
jgi:hypothetical protein